MFACGVLAIVTSLAAGQGVSAANPTHAEQLARQGQTREALHLFREIVRQHPEDVDARLWYARLLRRAGEHRLAQQEFRLVLERVPDHAEALTGLAVLLDSFGERAAAAALLDKVEQVAPENADVLAARGRHLRLSGRSHDAEEYYERARALSPNDADIRHGLEQVRRVNRHRLEASASTETATSTTRAHFADVTLDLRASDRVRVHARVQAHSRFAQQETRAGAGLEWRVRPGVSLRGSSLVAPGADLISRSDSTAEIEHVRGRMESVLGIRYMSFATADVWIFAPGGTLWLNDRTAISLRYYGSMSEFGERPGEANHSGAVRVRFNIRPRVWLDGAYSRGFESFEQLSADRLGQFRADTFAAGILYHLPTLQSLSTTVEYQHRSDNRTMMRVTAGVVHRF